MVIVDLYCGTGVAGTSIAKNIKKKLGINAKVISINHWSKATETVSYNCGIDDVVICDDLDRLDPCALQSHIGSKINILWGSTTCTHFSNAAGGVPRSNQLRSQPWRMIYWVDSYKTDVLLMENVPEIISWGPLYKSGPKNRIGKPIPSRKGKTFNLFFSELKRRFKYVEWKILCCADYGDATTRKRFFLQAKQTPIVWPEKKKGWVPARDIIDWSIEGKSIFDRKKPLVEATLKRIEHGLIRYGGKPFISILRGQSKTREVSDPIPTLSTGQHMALAQPFIVKQYGTGMTQSIDDPLATVTTTNHLALAQPFLVKYYGTGKTQSIDEPLDTITTRDRFALVKAAGVDIKYRMLTPEELARAHSFPDDFKFSGTKTDKVKLIGNGIPVKTAEALTLAAIGGWCE